MTEKSLKSPMSLLTLAIAATVALGLGGTALSANAADHQDNRKDYRQDNRPYNRQNNRQDQHRGDEHRDYRDSNGYPGGYYRAPPVVYGSPCGYNGCAPPPFYRPGINVVIPDLFIGVH